MNSQDITYANELGELLAPFLKILRATGFFEAYVFIPVMTLISVFIFVKLLKIMKYNGTFKNELRSHYKVTVLSSYYSLCFIFANVIAVAFKTLIIEEMDYETPVWYLHLVGPLHFYITSVTGAYLWLIARNRKSLFDHFLIIYIQLGMLGGYYTAIYRIMYEPFDLLDVTSGVSGVFILLWFGILNTDIVIRFLSGSQIKSIRQI